MSRFALAAAAIMLASPANAQTVSARLGSPKLDNGCSTRATAEKLYDEMDFQRAIQAKRLGTNSGDVLL